MVIPYKEEVTGSSPVTPSLLSLASVRLALSNPLVFGEFCASASAIGLLTAIGRFVSVGPRITPLAVIYCKQHCKRASVHGPRRPFSLLIGAIERQVRQRWLLVWYLSRM